MDSCIANSISQRTALILRSLEPLDSKKYQASNPYSALSSVLAYDVPQVQPSPRRRASKSPVRKNSPNKGGARLHEFPARTTTSIGAGTSPTSIGASSRPYSKHTRPVPNLTTGFTRAPSKVIAVKSEPKRKRSTPQDSGNEHKIMGKSSQAFPGRTGGAVWHTGRQLDYTLPLAHRPLYNSNMSQYSNPMSFQTTSSCLESFDPGSYTSTYPTNSNGFYNNNCGKSVDTPYIHTPPSFSRSGLLLTKNNSYATLSSTSSTTTAAILNSESGIGLHTKNKPIDYRHTSYTPRGAWLQYKPDITHSGATHHDRHTSNKAGENKGGEKDMSRGIPFPGSNKTSGKTPSAAAKCKSAVSHPVSDKSNCGKAGLAEPKKSKSENPDHNNNFFNSNKTFFKNPSCRQEGDTELQGHERICKLAQPKHYHCIHHRHHCGDDCPGAGKKLTAASMERFEKLAQPKLAHYTVCSCCLSPNCLGECSTKMNVNRTTVTDPRRVNWNRLAKPRPNNPPPLRTMGDCKIRPYSGKKTMSKACLTKRLEKLSIPRKVINSTEYYLWLWNKKPDVHVYLRPIQRLSVAKCDLKDNRVLLRCDLDFTKGKPIDNKVRDALPTIQMALKKEAKSIVIISRCGPDGAAKDLAYSLKPLAQVFEEYLGTRVIFLDDCVGFQAQALCEDPVPGTVFLLENLSFHPEELGYVFIDEEKYYSKKEEVNKFKKIISDHGDIYFSDSFAELVNMTNTTIGYPTKDFGYGLNVKKELNIFGKFALRPPVPVLAIVAGDFEKVAPVVKNLMGQVTDILVGGHVGSVFMRIIKGINLGNSECTPKMEKKAHKIFSRAKDTQTTLHLPSDVVVRNVNTGEYFVALTRDDIDDWFEIVDIGPHTRKCFQNTIKEAAAIIWLGDFGPLSDGTEVIKQTYLEAAKSGTPTYAADDTVKKFIGEINQPQDCLFVTGDGQCTVSLLRGKIPKGMATMSKSRRKLKRESEADAPSTKPLKYELPGMMIPGGSKAGLSYGASNALLCINHIPLDDLKILIRVEFNEPMKEYTVTNNYRMRMTIPTIKYALKWRARAVVIVAHFRSPQGRRDTELSLKPICDELATLLGETVIFVPRTVGKDVMTTINQVHPGSVLMVENLRFHAEEEAGYLHTPDGRIRPVKALADSYLPLASGYTAEMNAQFCEELSRLGDIYVNDAFAALHKDHASITGILRQTRVCGFLVKNELKYLAKLLNYPNRKFLVILGGVNMEDKLSIMPGILKEADSLILAGSLACLFLKIEHGLKTGRMLFNERLVAKAREMVKLAAYYKCRLHYPVDLAVSQEIEGKNLKQVSVSEGIPKGYGFVDIGNLSASMFTRIIKRNQMIFWMGVPGNGLLPYEKSSTKQMMEALHAVTNDPEKSAVTIVGGRGLCQVVEQQDPEHESFTHLTTGGRVALQLFAERSVLGLESLMPKPGKRPMSLMGVSEFNDFKDQVVLLRCDLDIPLLGEENRPLNTFPLQHVVETVKSILKKGAKAILLVSQRGEPDGEVTPGLSLEPVKPLLEEMLEQEIDWIPHNLGTEADTALSNASKGAVILVENICFNPEEGGYMKTESGYRVPVSHEDLDNYRNRLSTIAGVYVNESFASLHHAYSSVVGVSRIPCIAGATLKKAVYDYVDIRRQLDGGSLLIMGSEVLEDIVPKLLLLLGALDVVEEVFLCGNIAAVFKPVAAQANVKEFRDAQLVVPRIVRKARLNKITLNLAADCLAAKDPTNPDEEPRVVQLDSAMPRGFTQCDMGPAALTTLTTAIKAAKLIVLCGPTGQLDYELHTKGTKGIIDQLISVTNDGSATTVALGMRTIQFLQHFEAGESLTSYSVDPQPFFHIMMRRPLAGLQILDRMPASPLKKLSMEQMSLGGKRVLLRLDLDVPSVEGVVLDTDKLEDAAPTIQYILNQGPKYVVLMGHRGEPGGFRNYYLRMEPLVVEISAILGVEVTFIDRPCSRKAKRMLENPEPGSVFLMENLKFYPAESGVDAEPRKLKSSRKGNESLTEVSDLPKDDTHGGASSAAPTIITESEKGDDATIADNGGDTEVLGADDELEESVSDEQLSISDGEGGLSVDSLMYQLMRPKTVKQFVHDLADCGDVFVMDDVAHVEEPLTSFQGFELEQRGCGLLLAEFLKDSEDASVYNLPGVEYLSPAP